MLENKMYNINKHQSMFENNNKSFRVIMLISYLLLLHFYEAETKTNNYTKYHQSSVMNNLDISVIHSDYDSLFNYNFDENEQALFTKNNNLFKRDLLYNNQTFNFEKTEDQIVDLNSKSHRFIERGENIEFGIFNETENNNVDETELNIIVTEKSSTTLSSLSANETIVNSVNYDNFDAESDKSLFNLYSNTTVDPLDNDTTTEYFEECVGHPDYCNLTRDQYIELLQEYVFPEAYEWVLIVCHGLVFFVGLVGNALVCVAVYRNHSMRTVTNYFIVNLAVADFMVILFCLPPTVIWDVTETWIFGNAMCRIVLYFQSVSVTVSVLTLTFISVDRWYAICFPLKFKSTTGRAKTAIFVIWLLSLIFNMPEFVVLQTKKSSMVRFDLDYFTQCAATWSRDSDLTWHIIKAVFLYTLPLLLMTIAYCQIVKVLWKSNNIPGHCESQNYNNSASPPSWASSNRRTNTISAHANASTEAQVRTRRKAAKMLVAVVIMFAVCYFPVHLICVLRVAFDVEQSSFMTFLALVSHWLCYANSAVNPLIYNFMSGKFRQEFRRSFFGCRCLGLGPSRAAGSGQNNIYGRGAVSRAGTRRSESCASYRLAHLSNCDRNDRDRSRLRTQTTFIENNNSRKQIRSDSVSDNPATKLTLDMESRQ